MEESDVQPPRNEDGLQERMAQGQRLHPLTLGQRVLKSLPALFFALLPLLARSSSTGDRIGIWVLIAYGFVALPLIVLQYLRFQYWITPREITIQSGILTQRKRSIPIDRIQNIEVERSLLPRLLGTAKVKIETAGSTGTEGVLEYVSLDEAHAIRRVVRGYQQEPSVTAPVATETPPIAQDSDARDLLFEMPLSRVLLSGAFRFSLIYIALIFSGLQYLLDVMGMDADEIATWLVRGGLRPYALLAEESPWLIGLLLTGVAALLGWSTGILINLNKYYGFRLWRADNKLQRRHGLLTVSEGTIPLPKVQALILRSNPLMRRYGWYRLALQTMGADVDQKGHQLAAPFAQLDDVLRLAPHIRPFTLPEVFTPVSRITIRRGFVRYSVVWLLALLPLAYFFPVALWGLLALPLLFYFAVLQYRNHGYAFDGEMLFIRRGVIRQHLWIIPLDKFQVFYTEATYFQRRLGLASVIVDTAGAASYPYPQIVDVEAGTAERIRHTLYMHFQQHFDGTRENVIHDTSTSD